MLKVVLILFCAIATIFALNIIEIIDRGVAVSLQGDGTFRIGAVTIPADTLCRLNNVTIIPLKFMCHLCYMDCKAVHNRYGGRCGASENRNGEYICLCSDQAPPPDVKSAAEECGGPLTIFDLPYLGINYVVLGAFETVGIVREDLLQCAIGDTGCQVDCDSNHQYFHGNCINDYPVQQHVGDENPNQMQFCNCTY